MGDEKKIHSDWDPSVPIYKNPRLVILFKKTPVITERIVAINDIIATVGRKMIREKIKKNREEFDENLKLQKSKSYNASSEKYGYYNVDVKKIIPTMDEIIESRRYIKKYDTMEQMMGQQHIIYSMGQNDEHVADIIDQMITKIVKILEFKNHKEKIELGIKNLRKLIDFNDKKYMQFLSKKFRQEFESRRKYLTDGKFSDKIQFRKEMAKNESDFYYKQTTIDIHKEILELLDDMMRRYNKFITTINPRIIRYAKKIAEIEKSYLERLKKMLNIMNVLAKKDPSQRT